jgi:TonB family protein
VTTLLEPERPRFSTLFYFLLVSIALHLLLLLWLRGAKLSTGDIQPPPVVVKLAPAPAEPKPAPQQVAKAPAPVAQTKPSQQIVAPSDQENNLPPDGRAFLSDRDNSVDKETIKKGNPEAGQQAPPQQQPPPPQPAPAQPPAQVASAPKPAPPPAPKPAPAPERAAKAPPQKAPPAKAPPRQDAKPQQRQAREVPPTSETRPGETIPQRLPGLNQLFAPPDEVLARAEIDRRSAAAAAGGAARPSAVDDPRKDLVSAPPPAPGLFSGMRGSFDAVPDVAQGNLTMLNTKADRFAPFVRRVGTRVFQNLLIFQRQNLEPSDIIAATDIVTANVTLDPKGRLKNIEIEDHSGSMAVDQTLLDALRQAAFDDNPPKAAANDKGEYEFVFQAQLLAGVGPGPRGAELRSVESRLRIGLL